MNPTCPINNEIGKICWQTRKKCSSRAGGNQRSASILSRVELELGGVIKTESMKEFSDDLQIDTTTERKQYLTCQPFLPNSVSPAQQTEQGRHSVICPPSCVSVPADRIGGWLLVSPDPPLHSMSSCVDLMHDRDMRQLVNTLHAMSFMFWRALHCCLRGGEAALVTGLYQCLLQVPAAAALRFTAKLILFVHNCWITILGNTAVILTTPLAVTSDPRCHRGCWSWEHLHDILDTVCGTTKRQYGCY